MSKIIGLALALVFLTGAVRSGGFHDWTFQDARGWPGGYFSSGLPRTRVNASAEYPADFFDRLNASFPDEPISEEQLVDDEEANLFLGDCGPSGCAVSMTFLHEVAGHRNSIGYFTFDVNNPPTSINEIGQETIVFPNFSYDGSGASPGLASGDRVELGSFPSNTGIGFVLVSNAYNSSTGVTDPPDPDLVFYTIRDANPESTPENRRHSVMYYDAQVDQFIFGMEDLNRDQGSDDDANDALFAIKVTPSSAVTNRDQVAQTADPDDTDGDGLDNADDDFPNDPERGWFTYYIPTTLSFEDNWPLRADYDMNDLLVEELIRVHYKANGRIKDVIFLHNYAARGAQHDNGFALQLLNAQAGALENLVQIDMNAVSNSTSLALTLDMERIFNHPQAVALAAEADPAGAVIIAHRQTQNLLPASGGEGAECGSFRNTVQECNALTPRRFMLAMTFTEAHGTNIGLNPLLIAGNRSHEIHPPNHPPTLAADLGLFGTGDDDSDPGAGRYYLSEGNLPWAIRVPWVYSSIQDIGAAFLNGGPGAWAWPVEHAEIFEAYPQFANWAASGGSSNRSWYHPSNADSGNVFLFGAQ